MKRFLAISILALTLSACDKPSDNTAATAPALNQCMKDTDCKGERICESGQCVNPSVPQTLPVIPSPATAAPAAPTVAYEALIVSGDEAGPFSVQHTEMGTALTYLSRAGVMNLMESIVEYPDATGYVTIEKAYAFGPSKYVLVISTGENGRSCPATTYALSFDIKGEYVNGSTEIDGCSELVEAFADDNKLSIKKEGETTVIYNAEVK